MHYTLRQSGLAVEDGACRAKDLDDMCIFCCDVFPNYKDEVVDGQEVHRSKVA